LVERNESAKAHNPACILGIKHQSTTTEPNSRGPSLERKVQGAH